jgi:hypothetical protein
MSADAGHCECEGVWEGEGVALGGLGKVIRVTHVLDSRVEIKLVRRNGTKAVWQRNGGGTVKTRKSMRSANDAL